MVNKGTNTQRMEVMDLIHPMIVEMMPRITPEVNTDPQWRPEA